MARRKRKRRARRAPLLALVAIALVVAGFLTRRMLVPRALHYLRHDSSDHPPVSAQPAPAEQSSLALKPARTSAPAVSHRYAANAEDAARSENASARNPSGSASERITEGDRRTLDAVLRGKSK